MTSGHFAVVLDTLILIIRLERFLKGLLCSLLGRAPSPNHKINTATTIAPCLAISATLLLPKSLKREILVSETAGNLANVG